MPSHWVSFHELLTTLGHLDIWLRQKGYKAHDRFRQMISLVSELSVWKVSGETARITSALKNAKYVSALVEANEFSTSFPALVLWERSAPAILHHKLENVLSGPLNPEDESSTSNIARNTMFELVLGGLFVQKGVQVDLDIGSDLVLTTDQGNIRIVCKRPFAEHSLDRAVHEAEGQLAHSFEGDLASHGVIAISVARPINAPYVILTSSSEDGGKLFLANEQLKLANRHLRSLHGIREERVIQILFHMSATFDLGDRHSILTQMTAFNLPRAAQAARPLVDLILKVLGPPRSI